VQNLQIKLYSKRQILFSKGDKADFAYLVLFGEIGFYQYDFARCKKNEFRKIKRGGVVTTENDATSYNVT
jgi:CRP-like cAMP-binding protein